MNIELPISIISNGIKPTNPIAYWVDAGLKNSGRCQTALATFNPGDEVTLTTLRDGESLEMKVILGDTSKD